MGGWLLASAFLVSGVIHLVRPQVFEGIVPRFLPWPRELVYISGVAELVCAAGLLHPRYRRRAGQASALLLLCVLPANVQMAVDGVRSGPPLVKILVVARIPLQWILIRTALRAGRRRASAEQGGGQLGELVDT